MMTVLNTHATSRDSSVAPLGLTSTLRASPSLGMGTFSRLDHGVQFQLLIVDLLLGRDLPLASGCPVSSQLA